MKCYRFFQLIACAKEEKISKTSEQQLRKYYVYNAHTKAEESWKYYVLHVPKNEGFYNTFFY